MTIKTLEKANRIRAEINAIVDLETLFRNASMPDAELWAYKDIKVLNRCTLCAEIADKLIAALHDEEERLSAELEAL